ncbi:MAG TPA: phospho-N-acetylmuramoyl-pentapeptide-transferase [Candidatus Hydrogenedentes bacterium]|nr:phospho-N-acetylmuramoyl-pentapeptide-transferase [Candidatus Hydrogenedentota bacterium]
MFYYISENFSDTYSVLNVFGYHTVRAGGALFTGFVISLLIGPKVLSWLRAFKVGQFIRKDHVQDLHELHKDKAGTPTMGGVLIILSTLFSLLLWSSLNNRIMWIATGVLVAMGAVGFVDDYIKLRRKHNDGLSARAKLAGQVLVGTVLGAILVANPITYGASYLNRQDVMDWKGFTTSLVDSSGKDDLPLGRFVSTFPLEVAALLQEAPGEADTRAAVLASLNDSLELRTIYDAGIWEGVKVNGESDSLLSKGFDTLNKHEMVRLNRLLLESVTGDYIVPSPRDLQTKVAVPGFKNTLIPLGIFYIPFVILIIVGTSNGVNLTDGLDGLAIGASVVALSAFTALAYVVSRADWSSYLFVTYIPEATELAVFGGALLGTGLGFLWFNAHPAEVFMGDTGSLALGGVLGTMAILTKQELLLPIVGGLFVIEALSVIIQVGSFKLRKKRVFRMAPLHHHFELLGWSETKVTIRFWIIAFIFALMSLATLKLR